MKLMKWTKMYFFEQNELPPEALSLGESRLRINKEKKSQKC